MPNPFERRRSLRGGLRHAHFLGLALPALVACSTATPQDSSPDSVPDTGAALDAGPLPIDRATNRDLTDLTLEERKQLCDWTANIGGGYGKVTACDGGLAVSNMADQASCLASYLGGCDTVTVTDWEACRRKEITDPCALFVYTAEECKEVRRCIGRTDGGPPPAQKDGG